MVEAENLTATGGTYNDGYVPYGVDTSIYGVHYVNRGDWVEYLLNVSDPGGYRIDYLIVITSYSIHYTKLYESVMDSSIALEISSS